MEIEAPPVLQSFFQSLKKLKNLRSLSLAFNSCSSVYFTHFDLLSRYLKRLTQLRTLRLTFSKSVIFDQPNFFQHLASTLSGFPLLSQLEISFERPREIPISDLLQLFQCFQNLKVLSDLTLSFKSCEITQANEKEPLAQLLNYLTLPTLHKLRLHFPQNTDDQCLETLSQVLQNLPLLQALCLNLSECKKITKQGLSDLGTALKSLGSLSSLALQIPVETYTASPLLMVAAILEPLSHLKKFSLELTGWYKVSCSDEIKELFKNLRFLKSLRFLEIISRNDVLEDQALEVLADSLKGLSSLEDLSLSFNYCSKLTNKGIEPLSCAIKCLNNLSSLAFKFVKNDNFDEKTLSFLGDALFNYPSLRSIGLIFGRCDNIKGFGTLFQALKQMKDTSDVFLHLSGFYIPSPEADYLRQRKIFSGDLIFAPEFLY